ncbi:hypothetical protein TRICI_005998 [Trichomonascus ciferrii]|uniref:GH16 domain-containing protein n=1 Tax=Trichomonascus ciferrii TaxID=44093 RepID=A0A642UML4_9ASCO|nr:hypothetical protein TRICI_005998 [Trichomonascus ciferrii]
MRNLLGGGTEHADYGERPEGGSLSDPFDSQYEYQSVSSASSSDRQRQGYPPEMSSLSVHNMPSSEFDRYPNRISAGGSPVLGNSSSGPTIARGNEMIEQNNTTNTATTASSSDKEKYSPAVSIKPMNEKESNPFIVTTDFSPFGGYPASSFPLLMEEKEGDDHIHNPDPILDAKMDRKCQRLDRRGALSLAGFICLIVGAILLFIVLPVLTYSGLTDYRPQTQVVEHLTNYEYGHLAAARTNLVDPDTPDDARKHKSKDGDEWELVFSDEFNMEGRTFYEGDDQFWQAMDFWYVSTMDLEWYSPDAVTTEKGALVLQLDAYKNHDMFYRSGMVQSWNKMCFTEGYIEVSAMLPGRGYVNGLWPGIWTLGNLGRPGYLASTEGVWPYTYNSCDAGITPNQSSEDGISYLPGQKLPSCTCKGHDHPNEGVGRGAPEIDLIEAQQTQKEGKLKNGQASQSYQVAPYDIWYYPNYDFIEIHNKSITAMNTYTGGPLQQAVSAASTLNHDWYELGTDSPSYQSYGYEYLNDDDKGYIRWFIGEDPTATMYAPSIGPNGNVGQRLISKEPMSVIMNLGISNNWDGNIDWPNLDWPSKMRIDYVRVYQPSGKTSITCDPRDYPTYDYIQDHLPAYENANLTGWAAAGYAFPPTRLTGDCE